MRLIINFIIDLIYIFHRSFETLKWGLKKAWEKVKEYHFIVWIGLGLILMYPLIAKIFGG